MLARQLLAALASEELEHPAAELAQRLASEERLEVLCSSQMPNLNLPLDGTQTDPFPNSPAASFVEYQVLVLPLALFSVGSGNGRVDLS